MKNIVDNLARVGIGLIVLLVVGGYYYLSASTYDQKAFVAVAADQKYLENNQQAYADCYYTVKGNFELITSTVINRFYNQGAPKDELIELEMKFSEKYNSQCEPVMSDYETKFKEYKSDQIDLSQSRLTNLDKLMKKPAKMEKQPSPIFSLYEEYDPKSLQYPINSNVSMLYDADDFVNYLNDNL